MFQIYGLQHLVILAKLGRVGLLWLHTNRSYQTIRKSLKLTVEDEMVNLIVLHILFLPSLSICPSVRLSFHQQLACPALKVKLFAQFQSDLKEVISTSPSYSCCWHVLLGCTKWPPELKIEKLKNFLWLSQVTTGTISTKHHKSDQYQP